MPDLLSDQLQELIHQNAYMQVDVPGDGFCGMHASIVQWILMVRLAQPDSPFRKWLRDCLALADNSALLDRCSRIPHLQGQIRTFCREDASMVVVAARIKNVLQAYHATFESLTLSQGFAAVCRPYYSDNVAGMNFDVAIATISLSLVQNGQLTGSCRDTLYYKEVFRACCSAVSGLFRQNEGAYKQERDDANVILGVNAIPYEVKFFSLWAQYQSKEFSVDAPRDCWLTSDDLAVICQVMQLTSSSEQFGVSCHSGGTHWLVELVPSFSSGILGLCEVDPGEYWVRERGSPRKVKHVAEPVVYVDENFAPLHSQGGAAESSSVHNPVHPQAEELLSLLDSRGQDSDLRTVFYDFRLRLMCSARMEGRGGCLSGYSLWQDPCRMRVLREAISRVDKEISDLQDVSKTVSNDKAQELLFWIAELSEVSRPALEKMYTGLCEKYNKRNVLIKFLQYVRDKFLSLFVDTGERLAMTYIIGLAPLAPKISCP